MRHLPGVLASILSICAAIPAAAQNEFTEGQRAVLSAIESLSAATAPGGEGADAYEKILADDYSRWTLGSDGMNGKKEWVEGIRGWFDAGWRVTGRSVDNLDVTVRGNVAFTRRRVRETYLGPDGSRSESASAVAEVWIREADDAPWELLRVDIYPLEESR